MSGVKRVDGWRTSDGEIWSNQQVAEERQKRLDFIEWCDRKFGPIFGNNDVAETILTEWDVKPREPDAG